MRAAGSRWVWVAVGALVLACDPWRCDFHSHGACVEFESDPPDLAAARQRVDALLAAELPYWRLTDLSDWRIQFRDGAEYDCYVTPRNDGCTDYFQKTLSVRVPEDSDGCFEASELLHELGHYALGDPTHVHGRWTGLEAQFAPMVWDRPDAAPACLARYGGVRDGMWTVNENGF